MTATGGKRLGVTAGRLDVTLQRNAAPRDFA